MRFQIRNYRRAERVDLEGESIIVVGARNQQGKTSTLQGIALCVTGAALPDTHLKKQAGELVRRGAEEGSVTADLGGALQRVSYPKAEVYSEGALPAVSPIAAGLVDICGLKPEALSQTLARIIRAEPTLEDLTAAFNDLAVPEAVAQTVWKMIETEGWDAALAKAAETGTKFKANWEDVTKRKWGAKAGQEWRPPGWRDELAGVDIAGLYKIADDAAKALEEALGDLAVDEYKLAEFKDQAAGIEEGVAEVERAKTAREAAQAAYEAARKERDGLGDLPTGSDMNCPACGTLLHFKRVAQGVTKLEELKDKPSAKEVDALRTKIAEADGKLARLGVELDQAKLLVADRERRLAIQTHAADKVKELEKRKGATTQEEVEKARAALDAAKSDVAAADVYAKALRLHNNIVANTALRECLAPGGLRQTVLARAIKAFNEEHLKPIWEKAGWPAVVIEPDMTITYDGMALRNIDDLGSGRWIARTVLQIALARAEGSPLVIIDRVDLLDDGNKNRFFGMLLGFGLTAIVGQTANKPASMKRLLGRDVVAPYWIEEGIARPLADVVAIGEAA